MIWVLVFAALAAMAIGSRWFADYVCGAALLGWLIAFVRFEWGNVILCLAVFWVTFFVVYRQELR